jgi:hypothetical protein
MTLNTTTMRRLFTTAMLATLIVPGDTRAQTTTTATSTQSNLALGETSGPPKGYAFLLPPTPTRSHVLVQLKPEDDLIPADQWTWKVMTTDNELKSALTQKWYAQAACPDNLTNLQVVGPGGTLTQNPLWNPIWGYFQTQSFTTATVKDVCVDWANSHACDPMDPGEGCPLYKDFDLVGGILPAGPADRLRLKASCTSGVVADRYYAPSVRVRCDRASY